jgi:ABC-type branched-subunit amino acid transport system ATPase component/ABC-type branched-subunit amino acid transport system permease subunit
VISVLDSPGARRLALRRLLLAVGFLALAGFPLISDNLYLQNMLILTFVLAVGASGWNIMGGYAGYISLGNSVFIGIGGYTTAILAVRWGVPPFLGCLVGGVVAGLGAAVLSLVTRRTRGMYFVIVTFAALSLMGIVARNLSSLTGGAQGLALPLPMWDIRYQNWPFYYALLALLAVTVAVSFQVRRSKLGMGLFAIQDDEEKATGLGLNAAVYKMIAFVLGSAFTGVAGGIYAYYVSFLNTQSMFDIIASVLMILAVLLGGRGTVWGPVLGAFIVEPLAEVTTTNLGGADAGAIRLLLFAGILIVVVLALPKGVLPTITERLSRRRAAAAPVATGQPASAGAPAAHRPARSPGSPTTSTLEVRGLTKAFGGVRAVAGVDLEVAAGTITGLIGPNGSGKTTLFNLIDGTVTPAAGSVHLAGKSIERRSRAARAHAGLARTYQLPRLFPSLTVLENVIVPEPRFSVRRLWGARLTEHERSRGLAVLGELGLSLYANVSPADLSYGQRKLIELTQVLSLEPALVMLDEPAAGLSPALAQRLGSIIRELNSDGVAILLVEHDLAFLADLSDHVYVMANGVVIAQGTVAGVSKDPAVIDAYLGDTRTPAQLEVTP